MAYAREEIRGFTVTFRSIVLRAFTQVQPETRVTVDVRPAAPLVDCAGLSLAQRVRAAFTQVPPNETEVKVIGALLTRPGATSAILSGVCGWSQPFWQTHFGLLCQRRAAYLWSAEIPKTPDAAFLIGMLADYRQNRRTFAFKPEVAKVLRALDIDWDR